MKLRAAAVFAAFAVVAGALVAPAGGAPSTAEAAGPAASAPPLAVPAADDRPAPPSSGRRDLTGAAPSEEAGVVGNGALSSLVESLTSGDGVPDELVGAVTVRGDAIRVEVTHTDEAAARAAIAAAGGSDVVSIVSGLLAASVPARGIARLEAAPAVTALTLPAFAAPAPDSIPVPHAAQGVNGGDVYAKTLVQQWHDIGITGKGVSVGIIDYFDRATWRDARAGGEVPDVAGTFCRWGGLRCDVFASPSPDIHGVAVAEAIHDMAPKATIYVATVQSNEDLKGAIDYFASKKVKIISRSLGGFYDAAGDGSGASAKLVNYAVSKGITWFNSAGNSGAYNQTYSDGSTEWVGGYWRQKWRDTNANGWMDFETVVRDADGVPTGAKTYSETMWIYCTPYFRLRWNDWGTGKRTDYDIYRINGDGTVRAPGYTPNDQSESGVVPLELQNGSSNYFGCTSDWIEVGIYRHSAGDGSSDDVLELAGNSGDIALTASSAGSAGAAYVDSRNKGMAAVGAVDPVEGVAIAGYSSQGPTNDGRIKPEISAGSNFTSRAYTYAGKGGHFNGTSAATPVVAGLAAVVLERHDHLTPAQLVNYLRKSQTTDRGAAGADNVFGSGELIMKPISVVPFTSTPAPTISGTRAVGSTLTAVARWSPTAKFTYRWYRSGTLISGATRATYTLTAADGGKRIRVIVRGTHAGITPAENHSAYTAVIAKLFAKSPAPKITGTVKVGRTLTASVGTWSPRPAFTYQWKRNGKSISGATKSSYKLTSKDAGTRITVTVTAKKSGYKTTVRTSAKTATVKH
ncbi:S8 family serine peptidase [Microbacterium sp. PA5]|uniref:S8 family serine peptidase n=1 Tax=Microbacterium sp. PA5 TaxID=3416654 RepID=UPI003CEDBF6B